MTKTIFLFAVLLSTSILATAQRTVTGKIKQVNGSPLSDASVILRTSKDSILLKGTVTDEQGNFILEDLSSGRYLLAISHIGFADSWQAILVSDSNVSLPEILLSQTATSDLKGVTVTSQRPLFVRSVDKLTLNVEGTVYEKGENGLKLFNIIPGVQVTGRDIVFRGSESVTVYVDNRRILLPKDQMLSYLRTIPSESIRSYELKAVPGAENEAQNGGVIINIVLKSEYKYGLSGSLNGGYWYTGYNNTMGSESLNYRAGKLTLQGDFEYRRSPSFYTDDIEQRFNASNLFNLQREKYVEKYNTFSYTVGLDYRLSDKQTLGANYNAFTNPGDFSNVTVTSSNFLSSPDANKVDSSLYSYKMGRFKYRNEMLNAFYRYKLDSLGSKLDAGYSYIYYDMNDPFGIETRFLNGVDEEYKHRDSLFTNNVGKSSIHVFNLDLEKDFPKSLVLSFGSRLTLSKTDYSMLFGDGLYKQASPDSLKLNRFLYNETILAFYGTIAKSFHSWQVKGGLRTEQTRYNGKSVTDGQVIGRNQWDLFPSAYINRKIKDIHSITLSYARRFDRPGFRQLNPFVYYTSAVSIQEGNPDLVPYFSNNLQLEYSFKNAYSFSIGYQNTSKGITNNVSNSGTTIISKDENISNSHNFFVSAFIPVKLTSWWSFSSNLTARTTTIDIQTFPVVHRSKFSQNLWASNKFNLPKGYFIELSGFYNRNEFYGIYDARNAGRIDLDLKKSFIHDKLTCEIELIDPLHLYKGGYNIITDEFVRNIVRTKIDYARNFGIWLTYDFSKGKKSTDRERVNAGGDETRGRL